MDHASRGSAHDAVDRVSELLQQVLEASPETQAAVLDELCARHPECAALLRHGYGSLANLGLLQVGRTTPAVAPVGPAASAGDLPRMLGPFRLLELLGAGGMGAVYRAEDTELGRQVALKLIRSEMLASERTRTRFQREAAALARLDHPGLCTVYRAGSTDGQPWIAMRLVTGITLARQIDARRQAEAGRGGPDARRRTSTHAHKETRRLLQVFEKIARALATAHAVGVVHRDLKPANVVLTGEVEPVVIDFGLVHLLDSEAQLTLSGDLIGTPAYMAPEQIDAAFHEPATTTDVYSLGVTLFEALTLESPYLARTREELFQCIVRGRHRRLRQVRRDLPAELELVLEKALEHEPARRYASMSEFAEDLRRFLAHEPLLAAPPSAWYRLRKLARRYPGQVFGGSAVLVTAVVGAAVALQFALGERAKVREFDLLSGVVLLERALANEKDLYPPWPHKVQPMEKWLKDDAGVLLAMRPEIERTVRDLRARALPRTAAEIEEDRRTHPRFAEYELLDRRVASLRRAQAVRRGEPLVVQQLSTAQQALDARSLNAFAWARVAPPAKEGKGVERIVYGEESLGLAAARLAATKAKGTPAEHQILDTLAWALVANGQDADAKQTSERAYDLAPGHQRAVYEDHLHAIEMAAAGAVATLATAEQELAALSAVLGEPRTWRFALESQGFLHTTLVELLGKVESLETRQKAEVEQRLVWAKQVQQLSLEHPNARCTWAAVRSAIAQNPKYGGQTIELRDQDTTGLVPIGENPVTQLWEFYELRSAWDGTQDPRTIAIPAHEPDGSIAMTGATGIVFVLLPGGTFLMGAQAKDKEGPNFDPDARDDESPVYEVTLAPFFLARHELTRGQWQRLTATRPFWYEEGRSYDRIAIGPIHPAESIDWDMASQCMARHRLLLPTEAQWEYGCRAGTTTPWWCGPESEDLQDCANVHDQTSVTHQPQWGTPAPITDGFTGIAPVGSFRANAFGLFDVHGNVWEWCQDWYGAYDADQRTGDGYRLVGASSGNRVGRGGCYLDASSFARSDNRSQLAPSTRFNILGLRPARTLRILD